MKTVTADQQDLLDWLIEHSPRFIRMSEQIRARPEVMWEEIFASTLQADFLAAEGFRVERGTAGMALLSDPIHIEKALQEFEAVVGTGTYQSLLPDGVQLPKTNGPA